MDIDTFIRLLQIGWPAIVTIAAAILARVYYDAVNQRIKYLEDRIVVLEGVNASLIRQLDECQDKLVPVH